MCVCDRVCVLGRVCVWVQWAEGGGGQLYQTSGFGVQGLGFRVSGFGLAIVPDFRVQGLGFRV